MSGFIQPQRRITQAELDAQRRKGWPDFHPEDFCHRCGGPNTTWWVANDVWDYVMRPGGAWEQWNGIICPSCFGEMAGCHFELKIDPETRDGKAFLAELERTKPERDAAMTAAWKAIEPAGEDL